VLLLFYKLSHLPVEMLEAVLMRTFLMLYSSDHDGDDDRVPYQSGKSVSAERWSFTVLSSVCWCWWKTLSGWPQSPTGHWVRHRLNKMIKRECAKLTNNTFITQCGVARDQRVAFIERLV